VSAVNPPRIPRYDIPLGAGDALWGFTWTGSWCGPKAATVVIPMTDDPRDPAAKGPYGDLRVPLTGPQPPCTGVSRSALRPGVAGAPGGPTWPADPVLPAPADWAGLSATLTLPATSPSGLVPAAVFTLLNRTGAAITLSPCPEYAVFVETDQTDLATREVLGCSGHRTCRPTVRRASACRHSATPTVIHEAVRRPERPSRCGSPSRACRRPPRSHAPADLVPVTDL
jgi:hypothetical protein